MELKWDTNGQLMKAKSSMLYNYMVGTHIVIHKAKKTRKSIAIKCEQPAQGCYTLARVIFEHDSRRLPGMNPTITSPHPPFAFN